MWSLLKRYNRMFSYKSMTKLPPRVNFLQFLDPTSEKVGSTFSYFFPKRNGPVVETGSQVVHPFPCLSASLDTNNTTIIYWWQLKSREVQEHLQVHTAQQVVFLCVWCFFVFCFLLFCVFSFGHATKFPNQGLHTRPLHWKCVVLTTGPPGKSPAQELLKRMSKWPLNKEMPHLLEQNHCPTGDGGA